MGGALRCLHLLARLLPRCNPARSLGGAGFGVDAMRCATLFAVAVGIKVEI